MFMNLLVDIRLNQECKRINKKEVKKFIFIKKNKNFQTKTWDSLQTGDIIRIHENEEFPADVLILDAVSNHDHKCFVRGGFNEDINIPTLKKSCDGTSNKTGMKISTSKFIEQISGIVKFEFNYNGYF